MPRKKKIETESIEETTTIPIDTTTVPIDTTTIPIIELQQTPKQKLLELFARMPKQEYAGEFTLWLNELRQTINEMPE